MRLWSNGLAHVPLAHVHLWNRKLSAVRDGEPSSAPPASQRASGATPCGKQADPFHKCALTRKQSRTVELVKQELVNETEL